MAPKIQRGSNAGQADARPGIRDSENPSHRLMMVEIPCNGSLNARNAKQQQQCNYETVALPALRHPIELAGYNCQFTFRRAILEAGYKRLAMPMTAATKITSYLALRR
jgi:hypothetical protein